MIEYHARELCLDGLPVLASLHPLHYGGSIHCHFFLSTGIGFLGCDCCFHGFWANVNGLPPCGHLSTLHVGVQDLLYGVTDVTDLAVHEGVSCKCEVPPTEVDLQVAFWKTGVDFIDLLPVLVSVFRHARGQSQQVQSCAGRRDLGIGVYHTQNFLGNRSQFTLLGDHMVEVNAYEGWYNHHADSVIAVRCLLPCGDGLCCRAPISLVCRVGSSAIPGVWDFLAAEDEAPVFPEPLRDVFDLKHFSNLPVKKFWRIVSSVHRSGGIDAFSFQGSGDSLRLSRPPTSE